MTEKEKHDIDIIGSRKICREKLDDEKIDKG